jgi:hypothetical protein
VVLPGFGSLAGQFRQLLLRYDVVLMSAADAEVSPAACGPCHVLDLLTSPSVFRQATGTCFVSMRTLTLTAE